MGLVPEENNQALNDAEKHEAHNGDGKYVFTPLDIIESISFAVFEVVGLALHEAEFHIIGYISDFFGACCGLLVLRHRMRHSKFEKYASFSFLVFLLFALLFFSFLCWSVAFKKSEKSTVSDFAVKAFPSSLSGIEIGQTNHNFLLWRRWHILSPINIIIDAKIFNNKGVPIEIENCQFEMSDKKGQWRLMPAIDIRYGNYTVRYGDYFGIYRPDQKEADNFFPAALDDKMIEDSKPIECFVLLEETNSEFSGKMRLHYVANGNEGFTEFHLENFTNHFQSVIYHSGLVTILFHMTPAEQLIASNALIAPFSAVYSKLHHP
jgi:hypothetical protein